jgi:hypothetical protein
MRHLAIKIVKTQINSRIKTQNKAADSKPFKPNEGPVPETLISFISGIFSHYLYDSVQCLACTRNLGGYSERGSVSVLTVRKFVLLCGQCTVCVERTQRLVHCLCWRQSVVSALVMLKAVSGWCTGCVEGIQWLVHCLCWRHSVVSALVVLKAVSG